MSTEGTLGHWGSDLTPKDLEQLAARWITPELASIAMLCRVDSEQGKAVVGRRTGDYAGILIPYLQPGVEGIREYRLRRDNPDFEAGSDGQLKAKQKYVWPPRRRNRVYFVPGTPVEWLTNMGLPIIVTEGEFKALALYRLATHNSAEPRFLPVAIGGVWNWRGTIGKATGPNGDRLDVKGPIPDLSWISWAGRRVIIAFDADASTNDQVGIARETLARHLRNQGAAVGFLCWDIAEGKGIDDRLAAVGPDPVLLEISKIIFGTNESERKHDRKKRLLCHAVWALQNSPEWHGVLKFNEFSQQPQAVKASPVGGAAPWSDQSDRLAAIWLQEHGVEVSPEVAAQAVETIARQNPFHPVRDYLSSLEWDGTPRIGGWLSEYLGVEDSPYSAAVGKRWLLSAVARIFEPGCKVDSCLILEGGQGIGKSRAADVLGGKWFTDSLPDLSSKDAAVQLNGKWIIELSELDTLRKSEASTIKAFLSRHSDRYRPPYGRRANDFPRQTVFIGTSNQTTYLKDESGGRRFWPVRCGEINIERLLRDRDQLWAEAVACYRNKDVWWLDSEQLNALAASEQADRFEADPWNELISPWVANPSERLETAGPRAPFSSDTDSVTVADVLTHCIGKHPGSWTQSDKNRVAHCLKVLDFERYNKRTGKVREWRYRRVLR